MLDQGYLKGSSASINYFADGSVDMTIEHGGKVVTTEVTPADPSRYLVELPGRRRTDAQDEEESVSGKGYGRV